MNQSRPDGTDYAWGTSENNRRAKDHELTRSGRKQLEARTDSWRKLTVAVGHVLDMA